MGFDLDCVGGKVRVKWVPDILLSFLRLSCFMCVTHVAAYDGSKVWVLPRTQRALNIRLNVTDITRQSTTYEARLIKYSKRGFGVGVPDFELKTVDTDAVKKLNKWEVKGEYGTCPPPNHAPGGDWLDF